MAHYRNLYHRARNGAASFQLWRGSVPVAAPPPPPPPQTHVYLYPYIGWFPPEYICNMAGNSDESAAIDYHHRMRMIDDNMVIDASTTSHTTRDQQMIDGHSITDLNLLPTYYYSDHISSQEEPDDGRNRNRGVGLSEEAISKHIKTRAATQEDTASGICTVCQDDLHEEGDNDSIATLDCGHEYHASCIKSWLLEKNVCPLCRMILSCGI